MLRVKNLKLLNGKTVSLQVNGGEVVLIKGANGSGKSLFLKSLAKLIPSNSEEHSLNSQSSVTYPIDLWRSKVLYLPPDVSFDPEMTLEEFLNEPFTLQRYKGLESQFNPRKYLSSLSKKMGHLSSGQRQKAALLRCLSLNAEVLLLDESFGHIDEATRDELCSILLKWKKNEKIIFMVSHFEIGSNHFDASEFVIL